MFRGYPFQHLEQGIGAGRRHNGLLGDVWGGTPGESWRQSLGIDQHHSDWRAACRIAYLRTRALWLPWGIHFGWNVTLGFLFGLPVSGLRLFNVVVRTTASGPQWVTGGKYGLEASATAAVIVLMGVAGDLEIAAVATGPGQSSRAGTASQ